MKVKYTTVLKNIKVLTKNIIVGTYGIVKSTQPVELVDFIEGLEG